MLDLDLTTADMTAIQNGDSAFLNAKGATCYRKENFQAAIHYYHLAAAMGNADALSNLGYCYLYGRSAETNLSLALSYFQLAFQEEHPEATYKLGDIYGSEKWGVMDRELSLYYYQKAVEYVTGSNVSDLDNLEKHQELQDFPSLCFALGRALMPEGELLTDVSLAYQFLTVAERGYQKEITNGATYYQSSLEQLKVCLANDCFENFTRYRTDHTTIQEHHFPLDEPLRLVEVTFEEFGKSYSYFCDDESIAEGTKIIVPVGPTNFEKVVTVERVYNAYANELSFPIHLLKKVKSIYLSFDEVKARQIVDTLLSNGTCLDLSSPGQPIDKELSFDVIKIPLGHFWLELNGRPMSMRVKRNVIKKKNVQVDYSILIKPVREQFDDFHSLMLCRDFDFSEARWIETLSDDYAFGNSWELNGIHFGITAKESDEFEDEVIEEDFSMVPYYEFWDNDCSQEYGFNLAWKPYESDYDSSLFFYTT